MTERKPPVPPEADLRGFPFMPLDVERLAQSDLAAIATGDEFRAAVLLWCAAWHQKPAGSVPDDDRVLAHLAGFGRNIDGWLEVKEVALRGFELCRDGRLYHLVLAAKVLEAWGRKESVSDARDVDRQRKKEWRDQKRLKKTTHGSQGRPADVQRTSSGQDKFEAEKKSLIEQHSRPPDVRVKSTGHSEVPTEKHSTEINVDSQNPESPTESTHASAGFDADVRSMRETKEVSKSHPLTPSPENPPGDDDLSIQNQFQVATRRLVDGFLEHREKLWPADPRLPATRTTLDSQARGFIEQGLTCKAALDALLPAMSREATKGKAPPNGLSASTKTSTSRLLHGLLTKGHTISASRSACIARLKRAAKLFLACSLMSLKADVLNCDESTPERIPL